MMAAAFQPPAAGGGGEMGDCKDSKHCHEHHLCKLVKRDDLEQVKKLVKDAAFFCKKCGRAARDKDNLCAPSRI
jgi:hypothetical protein